MRIEQDEEEREATGRRRGLIALAVVAVLVIAGVALASELRKTSHLQDCLMTKATNCVDNPDTLGHH